MINVSMGDISVAFIGYGETYSYDPKKIIVRHCAGKNIFKLVSGHGVEKINEHHPLVLYGIGEYQTFSFVDEEFATDIRDLVILTRPRTFDINTTSMLT